MDNLLREQFWKQLGEISLTEFPALVQWAAQNSPKQFYRYRKVSGYSLGDLKNNHLGFSRAKHFDDPFDAFIRIDYQKFIEKMKEFDDIKVEPRKRLSEILNVDESLLQIFQKTSRLTEAYQTDSFKSFIENKYKQSIRDNMCMACFTETFVNENMWLKYADSHKGFCLEYDFVDPKSYICDGCKRKTGCTVYGKTMIAYPVFYSETPFDTTDIFTNRVMESSSCILEAIGEKEAAARFGKNVTKDSVFSLYRMSLIKDICHEHDEEWRLIYPSKTDSDFPYVCVKPKSITLGLRMEKKDETDVIEAGKAAGVKRFYRMEIGTDNRLTRKAISV